MAYYNGYKIRKAKDGFRFKHGGPFETMKEAVEAIDDYNILQTDPENIYDLPGIRQSIEEDRK